MLEIVYFGEGQQIYYAYICLPQSKLKLSKKSRGAGVLLTIGVWLALIDIANKRMPPIAITSKYCVGRGIRTPTLVLYLYGACQMVFVRASEPLRERVWRDRNS